MTVREDAGRRGIGLPAPAGRIVLVLLSEIDDALTATLKEGIERAFNTTAEIRKLVRSLDPAYDLFRLQYRSPWLLARLRRLKRAPGDKVIGVVDVDLYSPGYDFVFGEAEIATGNATLSLYRLNPETYGRRPDAGWLGERAVKEATHELGHLYGLGHCSNPMCVMSFSTSVSRIDRKSNDFCSRCRSQLNTT